MNYRKSDPYPTKYHGKAITPELLVMHSTEGGSKTWLDSAFSGADPNYHYSVHWCIYTDGEVVEYLPWKRGEAVAGWHAGVSEWRGRSSVNYWSIGYELQHKAGEPFPEAQIQAELDLHRMIRAEYPDIECVTHEQVAMPRGRKSDPTRPWKEQVWPRVKAAWEDDEMSKETEERLIASAQASSYREAIVIAQNNGDYERVERLNREFYKKFPGGESGLPKDWSPPK